ncbi:MULTISPECIES: DNA cytosine methyltransferase [Halorubrum]|uniref:DNA (cytosine-5-)-methyltransferase n=1 Tax=Halorubrum hochstenium ATCC 700873 TaxID=1227481 RepID=M0FSM4_9EURY|nr:MULTISPECIES: DNA cytosine methyltransferase [Halorubrum]ELZ62267.1 cytosine-specific methyltransferase [Halorubrum hochstenium ATCC 700873]
MTDKIRVASLFTGAGGLDIGFSNLSEFEVIFHLDIMDVAVQTLETNAKADTDYVEEDSIIRHKDVTEYDGEDLGKADVDLVIGGPPCQPFSAAARRAGGIEGTESDEGSLFRAYVKLLKEWQPKAFLFENVYGITSDEEDWQMIVDAFENDAGDPGYHPKARTLDAADYGVPQHRERTFIVGIRKDFDEEFQFPFPTHGPDSPFDNEQVTAGEALKDIDSEGANDDPTYEVTSKHAYLLDDIPPGLNYSFYTEKLGHPEPIFGWRSRFSDYLYKADPEQPVRTLKAQPGAASGPFHWENRKFTEEELKALQTFPDDYILEGSYSQVVKQIGNSVPPRIAEVMAMAISEQLFDAGESDYEEMEPMPDDYDLNYRSRKRTNSEEYQRKARERLEELGLWEPSNERSGKQHGLEEFAGSGEGGTEQPKHSLMEERRATWNYKSYFDREKFSYGTEPDLGDEARAFNEESHLENDILKIDIERQGSHDGGDIHITLMPDEGLWNGVGGLEIHASNVELSDVFYIWDIGATEVIDRTRYEKFIDVVGHYSTTQLDYTSSIELDGIEDSVVARALRFFSDASNCNTEYTLIDLADKLDADPDDVVDAMKQLREWRYEVRTPATHATMPEGQILCTYPFPDMVETSHFDASIELDSLRQRVEEA